jgi:hypothetical protein
MILHKQVVIGFKIMLILEEQVYYMYLNQTQSLVGIQIQLMIQVILLLFPMMIFLEHKFFQKLNF